jgi:hypothetical protein
MQGRHTREKRVSSTPRLLGCYRWRLWNTGSPAAACHRAAIRPTRWRAMTAKSQQKAGAMISRRLFV